MREATGQAFLLYIILTFIIICALLLIASISYTKAFNVKNMIISSLEYHNGYNSASVASIEQSLQETGYRINVNGTQNCTVEQEGDANAARPVDSCKVLNNASVYKYCVYECYSSKGKYYKVTSFMYFDVPVVGQMLEFPIYGETRLFDTVLDKR